MIPEIRTERLVMRGWRNEDFDPFAAFWADPKASAYIGGAITDRAGAWRRMAGYAGQWLLRGYGFWVLQRHEDPAPIGYCGLWHPIEWPEREIGWAVLPRHQRQGFAREAARAALDYAVEQGFAAPISLIHRDNIASRGVAEKLGADLEREFDFEGQPAVIYRHSLQNQQQTASKE